MKYAAEVYEYLRTIPRGKVVTYKQIAQYLGNPKLSRIVGNILHVNKDPIYYPCFRVVNSQGWLAENFGDTGGIQTQRARLEADGIHVSGGWRNVHGERVFSYYVDLEKYQWRP